MPDNVFVHNVVSDLLKLKAISEKAGESTGGQLTIHPGLAQSNDNSLLRTALRTSLSKYLPDHLSAGAVMGLNGGGPEPWIFVALTRSNSIFVPFASEGVAPVSEVKVAQMISFANGDRHVLPLPATTNVLPLASYRLTLRENRRGVSTAVLFDKGVDLEAPAVLAISKAGHTATSDTLKNSMIPDWIANPTKSHFFNTDCASCHSESTRRARFRLLPTSVAYERPIGISGVDPKMLPGDDQWDVRNFGWFGDRPVITQRTANETAEVVAYINKEILSE
jgi:hypothetical protein